VNKGLGEAAKGAIKDAVSAGAGKLAKTLPSGNLTKEAYDIISKTKMAKDVVDAVNETNKESKKKK